jgi:thiol-disulfide isomerase/thioredoxin
MRLFFVLLLAIAGNVIAAPIDFTLKTVDGEEFKLSSLRGQWVVANYWATWCAPCRKEIPDFSKFHTDRDDVTVLGLTYEETDPKDIKKFLKRVPASYPILMVDVYDPPKALGTPKGLPMTYLISPTGEIVERYFGPITSQQIAARIDKKP